MSLCTNEVEFRAYGIIDSIEGEKVFADVYDPEDNVCTMSISFNLSDFSDEDREIATPCAVFDLEIGYDKRLGEEDGGYSTFTIRRRKPLTPEEEVEVKKRIEEQVEMFSKVFDN